MYRTIVEESDRRIAVMDVFSKLAQERILFIDGDIDEELANGIIAQMLYLDSMNHEKINIYINSRGGNVLDGFAIYDVSQLLKSPIRTIAIGQAVSMGAFLLLMGTERCATKHTRIMLHQPSGGVIGTSEDIRITHEEVEKLKSELYEVIESKTKLTNLKVLLQLDTWFSAKEALEADILTSIL